MPSSDFSRARPPVWRSTSTSSPSAVRSGAASRPRRRSCSAVARRVALTGGILHRAFALSAAPLDVLVGRALGIEAPALELLGARCPLRLRVVSRFGRVRRSRMDDGPVRPLDLDALGYGLRESGR